VSAASLQVRVVSICVADSDDDNDDDAAIVHIVLYEHEDTDRQAQELKRSFLITVNCARPSTC